MNEITLAITFIFHLLKIFILFVEIPHFFRVKYIDVLL